MGKFESSRQGKSLFAPEAAASIRLLVLAVASVVLMTLDHREQHLEVVRNALSTLLYPVQMVAQAPFEIADWVSSSFESRSALLDENQRLREKQLFINAQLQKLTALEAENRRLRALLESTINVSAERVLIAEILTVDFDPYRHQVLLNRGTLHGARVGQPLIDERGIIGQIAHANLMTSTAVLITDPSHALPVQINRNGIRSLAVGTGRLNELELPNIPNNGDVRIGDLVITSGLGGRFPRGYPVARVTRVEFDPGRPFARIFAQPTANLDRIREVLLILDDIPDPARPPRADAGEDSAAPPRAAPAIVAPVTPAQTTPAPAAAPAPAAPPAPAPAPSAAATAKPRQHKPAAGHTR